MSLIKALDGIIKKIYQTSNNIETDTQDIQSKVTTIDTVVDRIEVDTQDIQGTANNIEAYMDALITESAALLQTPTVANTWYTILNATSEAGFLKLVRCKFFNRPNNYIEIRVTLNAGTPKTYTLTVSSHAASSSLDASTVEYFMNEKYATSLKVEMRHTESGQTGYLAGFVLRGK